jgi:hypothetical protein
VRVWLVVCICMYGGVNSGVVTCEQMEIGVGFKGGELGAR